LLLLLGAIPYQRIKNIEDIGCKRKGRKKRREKMKGGKR
jgi:hypothetical protein